MHGGHEKLMRKLARKHEGRRPLDRTRSLKGIIYVGVDWIQLAQDRISVAVFFTR
jgi:hypothetical protein